MNIEVRQPDIAQKTRLKIVDVDIHPKSSDRGPQALPQQSLVGPRHRPTARARARASSRAFPIPRASRIASRRDSWPPGGGLPASDLNFMKQQYLDAYPIEYAIMNPLSPTGQGDQNDEFSTAMAYAANEFQLDGWNARDPRLLASVVVPFEDGEASAPKSSAAPATSASRMCCSRAAPTSSWARSATGRSTRRRSRRAFRSASTCSAPAGGRPATPAGPRSTSRT